MRTQRGGCEAGGGFLSIFLDLVLLSFGLYGEAKAQKMTSAASLLFLSDAE